MSDRQSADPYVVSSALRRRFREEKKIILEKQGRDDGLKGMYGLHDDVDLGQEDVELGREMWEAGRERAGMPTNSPGIGGPSGESSGDTSTRVIKGTPGSTRKGKGRAGEGVPDLASLLRKTTAKKYDPFSDGVEAFFTGSPVVSKPKKVKEPLVKLSDPPDKATSTTGIPARAGMAVLAGYESD
jgi:coiled-coil domain-containing protein 130